MRGVSSRTRERPRYDDEGRDEAARFLYAAMDPRPRIRGLETISLCRKWLDVEADRPETRSKVIAAINQRVDELRGDAETSTEASGNEVTV